MNFASERLIERRVTYTGVREGRFYIVENVPARVDLDTGEKFFSPETVDHLQQAILSGKPPHHTVETPVYQFAD